MQISELAKMGQFSEEKISYINEEISVLPQYKNLLCLGKIKSISINNQESSIYFYSSNNFYEILNFVGSALIIIFFIGMNKNYIFLFLYLHLTFSMLYCFINQIFILRFILNIFLYIL